MASSTMYLFSKVVPRELTWFKVCAQGYLLNGELNDICDHNAIVASSCGRNDVSSINYNDVWLRNYIINQFSQVSTVWKIIKVLYANPMGNILKTASTTKDDLNTYNQMVINGTDQSIVGNSSKQIEFKRIELIEIVVLK